MQLLPIYIHKRKQQGDADTFDNHQSDWFQARAKLKDYRSPLRYDHETNRFVSNFCLLLSSSFISLAPGTGLYGPGRAPDSFASPSPTVPGRQQRFCLEVRAVRELDRLHTEVNMSVHYLPEKPWIVSPPSGLPLLTHMGTCGGTRGRLGWAGHSSKKLSWKHQGRRWSEAPPGWQTPLNPKDGQCCLCRNIRWGWTGEIHSREVWNDNIYKTVKYSSASLESLFTFPWEKWTTQGCIWVPQHQATGIKSSCSICAMSNADLPPKLQCRPAIHAHTRNAQTADSREDNHKGTTPAHQLGHAAGTNRATGPQHSSHGCCTPLATQAQKPKLCVSLSCLHHSWSHRCWWTPSALHISLALR